MVYLKVFCRLGHMRSPEGRVGILRTGGIDNGTLILILAFCELYPCKQIYVLYHIILRKLTPTKQAGGLKRFLQRKFNDNDVNIQEQENVLFEIRK